LGGARDSTRGEEKNARPSRGAAALALDNALHAGRVRAAFAAARPVGAPSRAVAE